MRKEIMSFHFSYSLEWWDGGSAGGKQEGKYFDLQPQFKQSRESTIKQTVFLAQDSV
jgi:hypothetical protein